MVKRGKYKLVEKMVKGKGKGGTKIRRLKRS